MDLNNCSPAPNCVRARRRRRRRRRRHRRRARWRCTRDTLQHDIGRRGADGAKVPNGLTKQAAKARREANARRESGRSQAIDRAKLSDSEDIEFLTGLLNKSPSSPMSITPLPHSRASSQISLGSFLCRASPGWTLAMVILLSMVATAQSFHHDGTSASTSPSPQSFGALGAATTLVAGLSIGVVAAKMLGLGSTAPAPSSLKQRKRKRSSAEHICDVCAGAISRGRASDDCCDCAVKVPCTRCEISTARSRGGLAAQCTFHKCKCAACKAAKIARTTASAVAAPVVGLASQLASASSLLLPLGLGETPRNGIDEASSARTAALAPPWSATMADSTQGLLLNQLSSATAASLLLSPEAAPPAATPGGLGDSVLNEMEEGRAGVTASNAPGTPPHQVTQNSVASALPTMGLSVSPRGHAPRSALYAKIRRLRAMLQAAGYNPDEDDLSDVGEYAGSSGSDSEEIDDDGDKPLTGARATRQRSAGRLCRVAWLLR